MIIKGVANVQERRLAGRRVGHLGLKAAVLLRVFLPSDRVTVVGVSAHGG